jgi:23S rRNA (uracil1939-C5)-methyltransferase
MLQVGDQIEIQIDRLASGGRGVGRHEGLVVFVSDSAPNEKVRAEITLVKKNFAEAKLVDVVTASPFRVKPPCSVAGTCGGCTWQHVAYDEQLRQKRAIVADAVRKFAGRGVLPVNETVPSPAPFGYRNRIQLHFAQGKMGFFRKGSHDIVPIENCEISDPKLNQEMLRLREKLVSEKSAPVRREIYLTERGEPAISSELRFDDELGFAQVNEAQNKNLVRYVLENLGEPEQIFDLYAGAGNFALAMAAAKLPSLQRMFAVELHPKSVTQGQAKASALGHKQLTFIEANVASFLTEVVVGRTRFKILKEDFWRATVVLDPPRAGLDDVVRKRLNQLKPQRMIYVSCDPVTLARDLGAFAADTYDILSLQPFDMFPQTDHVESVAVLQRKS